MSESTPTSDSSSKKKEHRACHFVLTMTTEKELKDAASKGLELLRNEKTKKFIYAEDGSPPLALDLKLNLRLPLYSTGNLNQLLCDTSKICMSNWNSTCNTDLSFEGISCVDVQASPEHLGHRYLIDLRLSTSDKHRVKPDGCWKGEIQGLHLRPPRIEDADAYKSGYVILGDSVRPRALLKFERMSDEDVPCSCKPCSERRDISSGSYNIVKLERL